MSLNASCALPCVDCVRRCAALRSVLRFGAMATVVLLLNRACFGRGEEETW